MINVLKTYNNLKDKPFGKWMFSKAVSWTAPYFRTVNPTVIELRDKYGKVKMKKRWSVTNHIGTVHAIAMCNLAEYVAGMTIEASIPKHLRWIPAGMEVKYLKKAETNLTASCTLEIDDWDKVRDCIIHVPVLDDNGQTVFTADINMYVSKRKK